MARNLEPRIPEESLVIQLGYHYEDAIQRARRQGQIKTIQGMANLLEDHEKNKEELKCQLGQQLEGYYEDIKKKVSETNEKIQTTSETVAKAQEEIISKIKAVEDDGKNRIEMCIRDSNNSSDNI